MFNEVRRCEKLKTKLNKLSITLPRVEVFFRLTCAKEKIENHYSEGAEQQVMKSSRPFKHISLADAQIARSF